MTDDETSKRIVFCSPEDAPALMLGVESDQVLDDAFTVQGHPYLPKGMAFVVDRCPLCGDRHDYGPVGQAQCMAKMATWRPTGLIGLSDEEGKP